MFSDLASSLRTEKWRVLTPSVEGSEPLFEAGLSSARRKPVWMSVAEGAKIEASERVTSIAMLAVVSNCGRQLRACQDGDTGGRTREPVMLGSRMILLHARSAVL